MKKTITLTTVGVVGLLLFVELWLPGIVENQLNRVVPHAAWPVSEEARAVHDSMPIADLHADPLLWKRDWLEGSARGHTDLPRMQAGGVTLQILTAVTKSPSGQNYESNAASSDTITYLALAQLWPMATSQYHSAHATLAVHFVLSHFVLRSALPHPLLLPVPADLLLLRFCP